MRHILYGLAAATLIGGCSGSGPDGIEPGEWETTVTFTEIDIEGMPEELAAMLREQIVNQPQTDSDCITPEQAADPQGQLLVPDGAGEECTFDESVFEGGRIAIRGSCTGQSGDEPGQISLTGSYTATSIDAEISVEGTDSTMGDMRMTGNFTAERTGECSATESAEPPAQSES
ncbi:MAG: DUF3617 family protein [Parasphingopyxis sp.]|nr:DUF3617 domain-containing protein [Sphingomonadales bacterium]